MSGGWGEIVRAKPKSYHRCAISLFGAPFVMWCDFGIEDGLSNCEGPFSIKRTMTFVLDL